MKKLKKRNKQINQETERNIEIEQIERLYKQQHQNALTIACTNMAGKNQC